MEDFIPLEDPSTRRGSQRKRNNKKKGKPISRRKQDDSHLDDYLENCDDLGDLKLLNIAALPEWDDNDDVLEREDSDEGKENNEDELFESEESIDADEIIIKAEDGYFDKLMELNDDNQSLSDNSEEEDPVLVGSEEELVELDSADESSSSLDSDSPDQDSGSGAKKLINSWMDPKRWQYERDEMEKEMEFEKRLNADFDMPSDEEEEGVSKSAKRKQKKKEKREKHKQVLQKRKERQESSKELESILSKNRKEVSKDLEKYLNHFNGELKRFAGDKGLGDMTILPPMPSAVRKILVEACKSYHLLPKVRGSGKKKTIVIYRTNLSFVPDHWKMVINNQIQKDGKKLKGPAGGHRQKIGKRKEANLLKKADPSVPKPGQIVGEKAEAIAQDNVGHKMMLMMGWKPGESLGTSNEGIVDPIKVQIRSKRAGLGGI